MVLALTSLSVFAEGEETEAVEFGIISLLPPLLAIILAFVTKQVILSLFLGILVGATMMSGWNPFFGFLRTLDQYILGSAADSWNAGILIFTLSIGGMIGVMGRMGGTQAVAEALAKKAKTAKSAQLVTMLLGVLVFFDDYANTLIVGPTMRPLTDKMKVSREKLSYIVDSTAAPVAGLALISTWIGYEIGLIKDAYAAIGMDMNAYWLFIQTIPYRFYCILAIVMVFLVAYMKRDFGPMYKAEVRARKEGKVLADGAKPMASDEMTNMKLPENVKLKVSNAVVPILTLVVVAFVGMWYNGGGLELPGNFEGIREAFGNADASVVLIWAAISGGLVAIIMAVAQKILTLGEGFDAWVDGAKSLVITAIILTLAWSLGSVTGDVGTADYLVGVVTEALPASLLPLLVFLISCVIAFATGTSWGTMAIVVPLAVPLANAYTAALILPTMGAVLTGSVFGDHCSPISDTTIMSSMASASDHMDHVKTQIPYAVTTAVVAALFGFIPAGLGMNPIISLVAGAVVLWAIVKFVGKNVEEEIVEAKDAKVKM
ncbi:MAG: Na+/H+ antiporter NhaC family protein [Bacillota bacterium]|nr:Na+/H+ antiporter NhaC family protein [Bacillota bacterium]